MKIFKWIVIAVVLLFVVMIAAVVFGIDGLIRSTVEKQATSSLNLTTTLGGAHLSFFGSSLALTDLAIDSPVGFTAKQMFDLGKATAQVSYGQLRAEPIHINSISLTKPKLVIEQAGGKLNLQALTEQKSKTPTDSAEKTASPMKLIIDHLTIDGATVTVLPGLPGMSSPIDIDVPSINLENVGSDGSAQNGLAIKDVALKVMSAIAAKCADSDKLPPEAKVLLTGNLGAIQDQMKGELSKSIDAMKRADQTQLKDSEKKLKGLLGGGGDHKK